MGDQMRSRSARKRRYRQQAVKVEGRQHTSSTLGLRVKEFKLEEGQPKILKLCGGMNISLPFN